jgi:hypothetical protein
MRGRDETRKVSGVVFLTFWLAYLTIVVGAMAMLVVRLIGT